MSLTIFKAISSLSKIHSVVLPTINSTSSIPFLSTIRFPVGVSGKIGGTGLDLEQLQSLGQLLQLSPTSVEVSQISSPQAGKIAQLTFFINQLKSEGTVSKTL